MKNILVIISADQEWQALMDYFSCQESQPSPLGAWIERRINRQDVIFFHGGWGKIAAAASAVYGISRWQPDLLFNLGTCGGFTGKVRKGEVVLAERTVVYDIEERMGNPEEAIRAYTTDIDLTWLNEVPQPVRRGTLVSADRDLRPEEIALLEARYGALAGDWESGAIAWVATRYGLPSIILRGVSDVVDGEQGSAAYGNLVCFEEACRVVMDNLLDAFPAWLDACEDFIKYRQGTTL